MGISTSGWLCEQEEGVRLELSKQMDYRQASAALAEHLGLDDPEKLRFTQQNTYGQIPKAGPVRWREVCHETSSVSICSYLVSFL